MYEYQISVSANGRFMFRTEWDADMTRINAAATAIKSSMPLASVFINKRNASFTTTEVQ